MTHPSALVHRRRRSRRIGLVVVAVCVLAQSGAVRASDPPHWSSTSITTDCTTPCHVTHQAAGGGLTTAAENTNLCQSCHNASGIASAMPVDDVHSAIPGVIGTSHAFAVDAVNVGLHAQLPIDNEMLLRIMSDKVVCSTCHNQHAAKDTFGGSSRVRPAQKTTNLGSTGALASGGAFTGADGVWYLVEIVQAGTANTARFHYSKDNGISWFPNLNAAGATPVALDSGVVVTFGSGSYAAGERWEFAATWPFLRAALDLPGGDGSAMCRDCHRTWDMDHVAVETGDGAPKSHPVGVALGVNGRGYDRAAPLDGNGALQGSPGVDGNATNDLLFDGNGNIQCLTCHGVHFVDSNTLTEDGP